MDFSFVSYRRECSNADTFFRWLCDPEPFYHDTSLYAKLIRLKQTPRFGPLVEDIVINGLSAEDISFLADCGLVVAECFRRDEE